MINNGMSWLSLGNYINPKARNTELSNDYNQLTNRPIITLTGTSQNPIKLWKLDVGLYILNGYVQHTDVLLSEARGLFVSVTVGIVNGKYVISAFIPFWEGQYEYILPSLNSETYTEHQMIRMITQGNSLTLDNIREYFPTQDYHPTTKKYVDETMDAIRNELGKMGLNNNDVQSLIKENRRRDIAIQALLSQNSDKMVTIDEEVHNISMDYSLDKGIATINTLEGDTLVNVSKDTEYDKVLSYEQDIVENTNTIDLEVDGNVNPIIVGDTLVNVCTQNNPTAITNEYTVEGNNHFALQDEAEGNCRPIIQGNTIVNRSKTKDSTPLTTYVSEVEGNEMSLVDDTDTHIRVDKLVGDTMVNLDSTYKFVTISYDVTQGGLWGKSLSQQDLKGRILTINIDTEVLDTTYMSFAIYRSLQDNTVESVITYTQQKNFVIDLSADISRTDIVDYTLYIRNYDGFSYIPFEPNGNIEIMLLEGDYTNKPIPQEYFEGLKNSYEDKYIPENLVNNTAEINANDKTSMKRYFSKSLTDFTVINFGDKKIRYAIYDNNGVWIENKDITSSIQHITLNEGKNSTLITAFLNDSTHPDLSYGSVENFSNAKILVLEGDYTSNPPTYEEVMEHSGKYRCEVEVQGKNLCDNIFEFGNIDLSTGNYNSSTSTIRSVNYIPIKPNTTYILSSNGSINSGGQLTLRFYDSNLNYLPFESDSGIITQKTENNKGYAICNSLNNAYFCKIRVKESSSLLTDIQLEEGDTATAYEPYYNQTQTVYLNSPLLKGDEVVYKEGKLCHYHKMGKVVLDGSEDENYETNFVTDNCYSSLIKLYSLNLLPKGIIMADTLPTIQDNVRKFSGIRVSTTSSTIVFEFVNNTIDSVESTRQWLQANPTTVVYEIANPYYETISTSELLLPITTNCKLLTSSNIPLTTMSTRVFTEEVNILANTQYSLNFNSDVASTVNITLGGTVLSNQAIVKGYNKFSITTPSTLVNNLLIIEGSGVNISEVVVTEYDEGVCEYIEGLKSSFEDGYIPENKILEISEGVHNTTNTSYFYDATIPSELVNKTCTLIVKRPKESPIIEVYSTYWGGGYFSLRDSELITRIIKLTDSKFRYTVIGTQGNTFRADADACELFLFEGDWTHLTEEDLNHLGQYKVEYKVTGKNKNKNNEFLKHVKPVIYEGRECLLCTRTFDRYNFLVDYNFKPNTQYTLQYKSYFEQLTDDRYRGNMLTFMYTDGTNDGKPEAIGGITTIVTSAIGKTVKGIFGIYGYGMQLVNTYFDANSIQIEEGTVATEYEPYKESIQTVYLNSPLLKGDTIEEIDGEVYHVKRYYKTILNGSEYWCENSYTKQHENKTYIARYSSYEIVPKIKPFGKIKCDKVTGGKSTSINYPSVNDLMHDNWAWYLILSKNKLSTPDTNGLKQWLSENPITVVYKLAEPIYELIPSSSIVCKSYPNGHLDFDTNVHIDNTVNFVKANLPITYANTSTNYKLQFVSNKDMENVTINVLGNIMENVTINKGLNKISFTSPSDATNILTFEGLGYAYISDVQLVATDKDINYFKGLYSTYECGLIEDESNENYGKYEVNIVSYNAPIQFGKGGKIE